MNNGYVSLSAIHKAEAWLAEHKPPYWRKDDTTLKVEVYEGGSLPDFVIYWNGNCGAIYEARFTFQGEFVKLIEEDWAWTYDFNAYLQRSEVSI